MNIKDMLTEKTLKSINLSQIKRRKSFENQVSSDWMKDYFQNHYLETHAEIIGKEITKKEVTKLIEIINPSPNSKILDLGCGNGRHIFEFFDRGYSNLIGLDNSDFLINQAHSFCQSDDQKSKFIVGDARETKLNSNTFDYVLNIGNGFGYYKTTKQNIRIFQEAHRILKPKGIFLIDFSDGKKLKHNLSNEEIEWLNADHLLYYERFFSDDKKILYTRELIIHKEKGLIKEYIRHKRIYSAEDIIELLKQTGFSRISVSGKLSINSQQNRNTGMMGNRIIITATVIT